jgi:hypothetical protein
MYKDITQINTGGYTLYKMLIGLRCAHTTTTAVPLTLQPGRGKPATLTNRSRG